ncbi:hypothetical protein PC116_g30964, partial [Phytophthora cactorum]
MQISALLSVVAFSAATLAQPISMAANTGEWTITSLSRACDAADTVCDWTFGIDTGDAATSVADVKYTV